MAAARATAELLAAHLIAAVAAAAAVVAAAVVVVLDVADVDCESVVNSANTVAGVGRARAQRCRVALLNARVACPLCVLRIRYSTSIFPN
jgi:hypothetical protein